MAVRGLRLTILVFLVSSVAVNRDGEPYILLGEKNLPNHSYIKIGHSLSRMVWSVEG